ncbi:hypothetical protein F5B21DRAFT_229628 [Xylaria acuta]|nr:hypothetical protein F5B21DRAFT_229628 [Xylaria acuta]
MAGYQNSRHAWVTNLGSKTALPYRGSVLCLDWAWSRSRLCLGLCQRTPDETSCDRLPPASQGALSVVANDSDGPRSQTPESLYSLTVGTLPTPMCSISLGRLRSPIPIPIRDPIYVSISEMPLFGLPPSLAVATVSGDMIYDSSIRCSLLPTTMSDYGDVCIDFVVLWRWNDLFNTHYLSPLTAAYRLTRIRASKRRWLQICVGPFTYSLDNYRIARVTNGLVALQAPATHQNERLLFVFLAIVGRLLCTMGA